MDTSKRGMEEVIGPLKSYSNVTFDVGFFRYKMKCADKTSSTVCLLVYSTVIRLIKKILQHTEELSASRISVEFGNEL